MQNRAHKSTIFEGCHTKEAMDIGFNVEHCCSIASNYKHMQANCPPSLTRNIKGCRGPPQESVIIILRLSKLCKPEEIELALECFISAATVQLEQINKLYTACWKIKGGPSPCGPPIPMPL